MTKQTFTQKSNGDTLSATEWNGLTSYVNEAVDEINSGSSSHMYINDKGNLCIETTVDNVPTGKKGKINIESKDDI